MLVVRAAKEPDPVDIVPVRARESVYVIEFQRSSLAAAPPPLVRERVRSGVPALSGRPPPWPATDAPRAPP